MRLFCAFLMVIVSFWQPLRASALGDEIYKSVHWDPAQLASGSPCLLTVEFQSPPASFQGEWFGHQVSFFPSRSRTVWYALAGVDVETTAGTYKLTLHATMPDGKSVDATRDITIASAHYKQVELHVAENFVEPDAAALKRIAEDSEIKHQAFAKSAPEPLWRGGFLLPVQSPATDSFGTRRLFNGKLASIHRGMDFRAASGTAVHAANSGRVILARSLFYEGNCVVIDHGQQFMTIYMHLSKIKVSEGQNVHAYQLLGLSGSTGRATGPHLHFAVRWQSAYLDPAILFKMKLPPTP
ncbi:M23 family metallopeptidase [Alloacidobacterium dinghuense]|uniref:M23 family metallopeptidase n=1 Tax=Alloacidobacterium dinghuense TaxID=2763107 RepID=A0A7G8BFB8_9BACT|nr:M23 family metallopeptidase [Alloacidobacterium dinghuense]QNI31238.1 M23 family metallopeptidase [Alloacidobacterium dinghuense]